jgi:chorismate mutase
MSERELEALRREINALDRQLLEALNRRLELVAEVRGHKDAAGARWIDADREAELLRALVTENSGPLSAPAVEAIFSAVLDVMKQELAAERPARAAGAPARQAGSGIERLAVIGTGLVGASVALAARRAGVRCTGFDVDPAVLAEASALGAVDPAPSVAEAIASAELVVVAVPVGRVASAVRDALAVAGPDATVTDVASTKRALAAVEDPRFVAGRAPTSSTGPPGS